MSSIRDILRTQRVADLGPLPAPRLTPSASVQHGLVFLVRGRRGAIVLVDDELHPTGIFTERDALSRLTEEPFTSREGRRKVLLERVVTKPPVTVERSNSLHGAIATMVERRFRHLVVVDRHERLVGLLTTSDIVQFFTDQFPEETVNLPARLHQHFETPEGG